MTAIRLWEGESKWRERGREEGEIEEEVAMVDKACGAVTWVVFFLILFI